MGPGGHHACVAGPLPTTITFFEQSDIGSSSSSSLKITSYNFAFGTGLVAIALGVWRRHFYQQKIAKSN